MEQGGREMRRIEIDLADLMIAFESASYEMHYYLDLETGQVLWISDEIDRELETIYHQAEQAIDAESGEDLDPVAAIEASDLSDWEKEAALEAYQVERGFGTRYVSVPEADSREGYRDMQDFIATVRDERLQDLLWGVIRGRGAFRRFKDVLAEHPRERERWFEFKDQRLEERVLEWLEYEDIEPILAEPLAEPEG